MDIKYVQILSILWTVALAGEECVTEESEGPGQWQGLIQLGPFDEDVTSWSVLISFSSSLDWMESVMAEVTGSGPTWSLSSKDWDGAIAAGDSLSVRFIVGYSGTKPSVSSVSYDTAACESVVDVTEENSGQWAGQISLEAGDQQVSDWTVVLEFTTSVDWIESVMANVTGSGTKWMLHSRDWDQTIPAGGQLDLKFLVDYSTARPSVLAVTFNEASLCSGGSVCAAPDCSNNYQVEADHGNWQQILVNINPDQDVSGWTTQLDFASPLSDISSPMATSEGSGSHWTLTNKDYDGDLTGGQDFTLRFAIYFSGTAPDLVNIKFNGKSLCDDEKQSQLAESQVSKAERSDDLFGGSPLTNSNPPWDSEGHNIKPGMLWGSNSRPYPTNVWWQNMVNNEGDGVNTVNPYIVKVMSDGLHVCLAGMVVQQNYVLAGYLDNVVLSAGEGLGSHEVTEYDELSVTVKWSAGLEAPVVRGMPYATVFYSNLTPVIKFGHAVLSVTGSGSRYEVTLNNQQKWIVYSSSELVLSTAGQDLVAGGPFTGSVRVAGVWDGGEGDVATLDQHSARIPTGGRVSAQVEGDMAYMNFNWETSGSGDLLMMVLPHQLDTITNPTTSHTLSALKGHMVAVTGEVWEFHEELTTVKWGAPRAIPDDKVADIRAALQHDITNEQLPGDDPYFGGKKMALFARLSLIADEIGESGLAQQAREKVKPFIEGWLGGTNPNKLLYEDVWGGVVSSNGLHNEQADFGNGMYNDHHFHYGYHIYTAAVLARSDPAWGLQWNDRVLHMVSDVAEPSRASQWYPVTRTKDWYDGHAWASGIFAFADGKNQESTSESVNGWYAIYMWGAATSNDRLRDLGRLMTALEIRAAHRYWQMTSSYSAYPAPFSDNKAVGIVWSTKVDYATWFGGNVEFIHCIQMMPFIPISEELLRKDWIAEEYEVLKSAYSRPDPPLSEGWKGYIVMAHAVIDPQAAYSEALALTSYDDGNTKSNTLWWIATRPEMGGGPTEPPGPTDPTEPTEPTSATSPAPTTTATKGCCGDHSFVDPLCDDIPNDPNGGLGCMGCGVHNCRLCGEGPYIPCP